MSAICFQFCFFCFYHSVRLFVTPNKIFFVFPPLNDHFRTHSETSVSLTGSGGKINSAKLNVIYVRYATCIRCPPSLRFATSSVRTFQVPAQINGKNKKCFNFLMNSSYFHENPICRQIFSFILNFFKQSPNP